MFTGIIQAVGRVVATGPGTGGVRLVLEPVLEARVPVGGSVAVDGCCLTLADARGDLWAFDVVPETLSRTSLGCKAAGSRVNLELPLRAGEPLGGHFVQGHIDAQGEVLVVEQGDDGCTMTVSIPEALKGHIVEKGSVAIDGVSLTVAGVGSGRFRVALIPHTLRATTLGERKAGDRVNLEGDILAKYVASMFPQAR